MGFLTALQRPPQPALCLRKQAIALPPLEQLNQLHERAVTFRAQGLFEQAESQLGKRSQSSNARSGRTIPMWPIS